MNKLLVLAALIAAICGICGSGWADNKKLNILTSTSDLKSIVEEIGKSHVQATSICGGNQDPHYAEARPSIIVNARKADLFVVIGLELEIGYESLVIEGSRNPKIKIGADGYLDASEGVLLRELPASGKVDRSMGDVHPFGNPHYWLDPYNIRIMARNISSRLQKIDPAHALDYQANGQAFIKKIDEAMFGVDAVAKIGGDKLWEQYLAGELDNFIKEQNLQLGGWSEKARPLRGMKIVMFHRSWTYFVVRFGLQIIGEIEPKPGIPPGPAHLKELVDRMKSENARVILMESFYDRKPADFIARQTGASVAVCALSVNGKPETPDYISLIDHLIVHLLEAKGE